MTEAKHTPGPWAVTGGDTDALADIRIIDEHGELVATAATINFGRITAEINARLAAAAPDMLAALNAIFKRAFAANEQHDSFADLLRDLRHIESVAKTAIAKATGA